MKTKTTLFTIAFYLCGFLTEMNAQTPVMVKDINSGNSGSAPSNFTNVNSTLFFTARTSASGTELWKSDGTETGTVMVKEIASGSGSAFLSFLIEVNGTLFFNGASSSNQGELWKSDGTEAGTVMVKDINPGTTSNPANFTNVNSTLFFTATDGTNGTELWKSDGTEAGTVMIKDINPGSLGSDPNSFLHVNNILYFRANNTELWKSDGTETGTVMVKNGLSVNFLTNVNGTLFFQGDNGTNGAELWKSDGTESGTVLVKDIYTGSSSSMSIGFLTNVNGTLFFPATNGTHGQELWKSDGTTTGTVLVKDINPGGGIASPSNLANVNGVLYFTASNGANGTEVWKSDGTEAGTVMVKDINPGSGSAMASFPISYFTNVDGTLFFKATDGTNGVELWKSDGTEAGTVMIHDINPGAGNSFPIFLTNINGTLFFQADNITSGNLELWKLEAIVTGNHSSFSNDFSIYPNPSSGRFIVDHKVKTLEVYNMIGEKILQQTSSEVNLSSNPAGIYTLRIHDGVNIFTKKIVLE